VAAKCQFGIGAMPTTVAGEGLPHTTSLEQPNVPEEDGSDGANSRQMTGSRLFASSGRVAIVARPHEPSIQI